VRFSGRNNEIKIKYTSRCTRRNIRDALRHLYDGVRSCDVIGHIT